MPVHILVTLEPVWTPKKRDDGDDRSAAIGAKELEAANELYLAAERDVSSGKDAVLVSVDNVNVLQRAYPNYFLDTTVFANTVQEALDSTRPRKGRSAPARRA